MVITLPVCHGVMLHHDVMSGDHQSDAQTEVAWRVRGSTAVNRHIICVHDDNP